MEPLPYMSSSRELCGFAIFHLRSGFWLLRIEFHVFQAEATF